MQHPNKAESAEARYNRVIAAYDDTFNKSGSGIQVMADLEESCFANASTYVGDSSLETAFREGVRSVYLMIKDKAYRGERGLYLDDSPSDTGIVEDYDGERGEIE